jgi:uncharacterized protein Usg
MQLHHQLNGFRLTTAEILYHMPDHPDILQTFVWQLLDRAPDFPRLQQFLGFWVDNIEGRLHSVKVGHAEILTPGRTRNVVCSFAIH